MEKTVSSIVQSLLERGHITAEEALILLKAELNKSCCPAIPITPYTQPNPYNPSFIPHIGDPILPTQPLIWYTTGTNSTNINQSLDDNSTDK